MLFTSAMPTHAEKKQGAARIISFKTSQYRIINNIAAFCLCLSCMTAQLASTNP
jgi:hypothetical protein